MVHAQPARGGEAGDSAMGDSASEEAREDVALRDADGDRIADAEDACPADPEAYNAHEDEDGCPDCPGSIILTRAWELPRVAFNGTAVISPWDLDFTAAVILAHAEYASVEIAGSAGRGERNAAALSQARADVVREGLLARGVPPARLTTSARGVTDDGASVRFVVTHQGSAYPLCETPFAGCDPELLGVRILEIFWFAPRSVVIDDRSVPYLDQVATVLLEVPMVEPIEVLGHVGGRERRDDTLALARANAVIEALVARGVPPARLVARAAGRHAYDHPGGAVDFGRLIPSACRGVPAPVQDPAPPQDGAR